MCNNWTSQDQVDALCNLLTEISSNEIITSTGDRLYDGTYPLLITAGKKIMDRKEDGKEKEGIQGAAILALGIAGWNRGNMGKKRYARLAPSLQDWRANNTIPQSFDSLRQAIFGLTKEKEAPKDNLRILCVFGQACQILYGQAGSCQPANIAEKMVAENSKLLHFLAPYHFPIIDSKVSKVLRDANVIAQGKASGKSYLQYTRALWSLGFFGHGDLKDEQLNRYYQYSTAADPMVSHIRTIDCTLFVRGE